ncbi:MAG: F0F1 ATP synthase subunit A [Planctomycetes bacterium]|nr:F0F1 ATP synthase subunit A [Planctomycetota bacterium]
MLAKRLLITVWLCLMAAVALPAQTGGGEGAQQPGGEQHADEHGHHGPSLTMEMSNSDIFKWQFDHSVTYPIALKDDSVEGGHGLFTIYNVQPWQWTCLVLMLLVFMPVVGSFKKGQVGWFTRVMRGFCLWVRDEMVYSVMGKEEGRKFAPFFMFMFFFIVFMNVIGLIPSAGHGSAEHPNFPLAIYTATGTPYVTGALAVITLLMMLGCGIKKNGGFGFFKGLIPHGLPVFLLPIMVPIELISLVVKPFALTIRLFANMLAGHLVIASAIGLIFLFARLQEGAATSYLTALPCFGMAVFIYIIEAFITLLQAYIFTFLSVNFVYQSIHQDH